MNEVARLRIGPRAPWSSVLARVCAAIAANASVPVERLLDATLALEQLAAGVRAAGIDELELSFSVDGQALEVALGPVGQTTVVLEKARPSGVDMVLERLADEVRVESGEGGGLIVLAFDGG